MKLLDAKRLTSHRHSSEVSLETKPSTYSIVCEFGSLMEENEVYADVLQESQNVPSHFSTSISLVARNTDSEGHRVSVTKSTPQLD